MGIDIDTDPEDHLRREIKRPPNYLSLGMRLRLGSLFLALLLVLVMMKEARKPGNWKWLGFDAPNPAQVAGNEKPVVEPDAPNGIPTPDKVESKVQRLSKLIADVDTSSYPVASQQFWSRWFASSTVDRQRQLVRFMRAVVNRTEFEQPKAISDFISEVETDREEFNQQLESQIASLPNDMEEKEKLVRELAESKTCWQEKILPAWKSTLQGEDITLSQQNKNKSLLALLRQSALALVEDGSGLNRPDEGAAWLLCWEQALAGASSSPVSVQRVQLMSQPRAYRGKSVEFDGWVRSARKLKIKENELGLTHYYVMWVRPADTNAGPYCIYAQNLPADFPEVGPQLSEMNERLSVNGVFFKVRTYTASDNEVLSCPLVLADTFDWRPVTAEVPVDSWTPPVWLIATVLLLMPVVAGVIAWWVYTSTATRRFVHGPNTQKNIDDNLVELRKHPNIKTDLERVQSLERMELGSTAHSGEQES